MFIIITADDALSYFCVPTRSANPLYRGLPIPVSSSDDNRNDNPENPCKNEEKTDSGEARWSSGCIWRHWVSAFAPLSGQIAVSVAGQSRRRYAAKGSLHEKHVIGFVPWQRQHLCRLAALPTIHMRWRLMSRAPWNNDFLTGHSQRSGGHWVAQNAGSKRQVACEEHNTEQDGQNAP